MKEKNVIWCGRFDENYSRNRILRQQFVKLGYKIIDFKPSVSCLGFYEALLTLKIKPDFIWFHVLDIGMLNQQENGPTK